MGRKSGKRTVFDETAVIEIGRIWKTDNLSVYKSSVKSFAQGKLEVVRTCQRHNKHGADNIKGRFFSTSELEAERPPRLQEDMGVMAGIIGQCVAENARIALGQKEYQKKYDVVAERSSGTKA